MFSVRLQVPTTMLSAKDFANFDFAKPLADVGYYVCREWMPDFFKSGGLGTWQPVARGGQPLLRDGLLVRGFVSTVGSDARSIRITNTGRPPGIVWAQNYGMTIRPKSKKFLTVPAIAAAEGKKAKDFPGAFFLITGPEGPGVYRKISVGHGRGQKKTRSIEKVFSGRKLVVIPRRTFFKWFPDMAARARDIASKGIFEKLGIAQ